MGHTREVPTRHTLIVSIAALGLAAAGCGRSAPEGAVAADPGTEPNIAGVQVVSDEPVIDPTAAPAVVTTAPTTAPPATTSTYIVQPGDTLSVIAERFGVSLAALSAANDITDVDSISPGQELIIPG
jgi:LysM repeat protein